MLLAVFEEINFTPFFRKKIWDQKVDKNDLNFNKQYVQKNNTHFKEIQTKNVKNIKIEID